MLRKATISLLCLAVCSPAHPQDKKPPPVVAVFEIENRGSPLTADEYKALPGYLRLHDAAVVATRHGPLGRLDVVSSPAIHEVVDLSPAFPGTIPPQMVLTVDADRGSVLTAIDSRRIDGNSSTRLVEQVARGEADLAAVWDGTPGSSTSLARSRLPVIVPRSMPAMANTDSVGCRT